MYVNLYIIYFFLTYEENMSIFRIIWSDRTRTVWFVFAPFSYCMDANEFRVDTGLRGFFWFVSIFQDASVWGIRRACLLVFSLCMCMFRNQKISIEYSQYLAMGPDGSHGRETDFVVPIIWECITNNTSQISLANSIRTAQKFRNSWAHFGNLF